MAKIQVLDKYTAELIAAGEVVERPASVVKELFENAIDAGATVITVEIKNGGISYLSITDNGCGIAREDVPTAFLRHATSKVRTKEDLYAIGTLGFRGEALASVAAVSRVELITCTEGEVEGTHYRIEGGEAGEIEAVGCAQGTTLIVRDLFYNVPARMKFLKKDVGEANAVAAVMEKLAISHPKIAVRFIRDGKEELVTPGNGDLRACLYAVFGRQFSENLIAVDYSLNGIGVTGFISKPSFARANRTMQHFYVNHRYVKTRTAAAALEQAYKGSVMVGKFPSCVLFVDLAAETVDANVHPAKIEVRFVNEKMVFDAVYYAVRQTLEKGDTRKQATAPIAPIPTRPASTPAKPSAPLFDTWHTVAPTLKTTPPAKEAPVLNRPFSAPSRLSLHDNEPTIVNDDYFTEKLATKPRLDIVVDDPILPVVPAVSPVVDQKAEKITVEVTVETDPTPVSVQTSLPIDDLPPTIRLVGEIFKTYILAEMNGSLFCIDKHAAHERILYNELKANESTEAQMLLSPLSVLLTPEEYTALWESTELLSQTGFEIDEFGDNTLLVRAIPAVLTGCDIAATLQEIAGGLLGGRRDLIVEKKDWIYHSTACRAAIKAGDISQPKELQRLAERVLLNDDIRYCPHGRPVCVEWTKKELEKQFGRLG